MARRRQWIKLYCYERLHGSVSFQLDPDERAVWDELLCLAGLCGMEGIIGDHDLRPWPHSYIAHELHIPLELLETTLKKCIDEGRISENGQGLHITNWAKYQSEYDRQKPYRIKEAISPVPQKETLEHYKAKLRQQFSDLDFDRELERFQLYWSEGGRKLKNPKLALLNWMTKAREIKQQKGVQGAINRGVPGNRPAGAFADIETE